MRFLWGAWNGVIALSLRQDRLRLDAAELATTLEAGRELVIEALAVPELQDSLRASRARPRNG
jgi:TetR/AcrR family transcriptional regulator